MRLALPRAAGALQQRRAVAGLAALTVALGVAAVAAAPTASRSAAAPGAGAAAASRGAFAKTETISRVNLINGADKVVDRRTFSLNVDETHDLRDRQEINVSWSGAHPTGGIVADPNSAQAGEQEYPVVLMMCRGVSSSSAPAAKQISPQTCWTQTPAERFQFDNTFLFPPYRLDRYETAADRQTVVGGPAKVPAACPKSSGAERWVPFVAANGTVYEGGPNGCDGLAPEEANFAASLQPGNTTYAVSNLAGKGSAKFVITTSETNASLGCSDVVPCSLVVIPIMGISCNAAGDDLPPAERASPAAVEAQAQTICTQTGAYPAGQEATGLDGEDLAVSGDLWWSASNWRNRIAVPLTFAPPSNICALVSKDAPAAIYGSYLLLQATQQWSPTFCLSKSKFPFQHVQTGETEAKNLLETGSINAAFQASPPSPAFTKPVVQAPTAVTGFAVVYDVDGLNGHQYVNLRLDARLLAKLLTESYPSNPTVAAQDKALHNPKTGVANPVDLLDDPEFRALNPNLPASITNTEPASTILVNSSDSDVMTALTSYINADPEARAWLNGKADPWGMVVNPAYKGIKLPVSSFPLRDTFIPSALEASSSNPCLAAAPVPWLPLVASPVENPATITLDMQFGIANSTISCSNAGAADENLAAVGRETPGGQFILGITSLADARRYELSPAALETQGGSTSSTTFTSAAGRSFVGPTDAALRTAAQLMTPSTSVQSWTMPYAGLRTDAKAKAAYPGTMLISTDVATSGLTSATAEHYAQFLDFAAGPGQAPGDGNGQLPPGYLPLTSGNGLGKLVDYTKAAASAVAAQKGSVPSVTGSSPPTTPSPTPTPTVSPTVTTPTTPSTGDSADDSVPPITPPGSPGSSPSVASPSPTPTTSSTPVALSLGTTAATRSSTAGVVFPLMLALALLAGAATVATWRVGRPKKSP